MNTANTVENLQINKKKVSEKLIASSLNERGITTAVRDFVCVMLDYFYFPCKINKEIIKAKQGYKSKLSKVLSINYLLKKFYLLERLINNQFDNSQQNIIHRNFIESILSHDSLIQDDSDAFINNM